MIARLRDSHLEEIGIAEHRGRGRKTAARVSPDAYAIEIHEWILLRKLLDTGDLIFERVVGHIAIAGIVKRLRAERVAHTVDRHDDKAEIGERRIVVTRGDERTRTDAAALRARIDVIYDRIFTAGNDLRREVHQAVKVGLAVACLYDDRRRRFPAGLFEP